MTIHDNGKEFTFQSYVIRIQPITVKNPRPNLVEHTHRTLGDIIRTKNFENIDNYECQIGDYVKVAHEKNTRMRPENLSPQSKGPFQIVEVHANGTVKMQRRGHREDVSISRIAPFFGKEQLEQL